ncbi:type II toxin-antitoxin system RelE/ParE family toxin [Luteipulveratus sp. YIM 133132]|uniref:type II toxin-antitoxin system RelE family toxin n=1 Tax=Luteipulveratus flavus TaxID=3031728 RepID=UPI0023B1C680|nr:type II toxin-antitoxin system RelE/ParE family toxin [Luteipulveratus sp. YIM 133132]MDE9366388.1 type II toxin-antitoxin system RelE/ParE family toxin [Luteipulveratus sp. YIM 133132]
MSDGEPWRVEFTSPALRDLDRVPPRYAVAIVEFITSVLPTDPHRLGKPLRAELEGLHGARRGDYRVLYRIDAEVRTVFVHRIDHRGRVYQRR